ncbi:hypothetical protein QAD02_002830 [Eretmocerus hayati]|uniref:Uncharacterized protein n=1 Tax=Eretmocerus hayati TaxID=131215 RepID=A0ACC2NKE6_9HYME|nr:hypothetical protein QAD02_002830 [Eretmocerus hayati]
MYIPEVELPINMIELFAFSLKLRAKLTKKSPLKLPDILSQKQYFICTLLDKTGTIEMVVQDGLSNILYNKFEEGQVYEFRQICLVKDVDHANVYDLRVNKYSKINVVMDNNLQGRREYVEFLDIAEIQEKQPGQRVDFIGSIKKINDSHCLRIQGEIVIIREVIVSDYNENMITVVLMENYAERLSPASINCMVTFKKAIVLKSDNGNSVAIDNISSMEISNNMEMLS